MENTKEEREKKAEEFSKKQNMIIEINADDLIKGLKEKGFDVSEEKELITETLERCVMLSHLALAFS